MSADPPPTESPLADADLERYSRQIRFAPLGLAGQRRLAASQAVVIGCGALGTAQANLLVRSGVGRVRLVNRDFVDLSNLQRQSLFDEDDAAAALPKSEAAATKLRQINSTVTIEAVVADVTPDNVVPLVNGADVVLDGTDNFETRFLLNDACAKQRVPWVYGGCLGAEGQVLAILPGQAPCLRCLMGDPPQAGAGATCDTAGVVAPIVAVVAAMQAMEALKILSGNEAALSPSLAVIDLWSGELRRVGTARLRAEGPCPTCRGVDLPWLDGRKWSRAAVLCGRNSVQVAPASRGRIDLDRLAARLETVGEVTRNPFLVRCRVGSHLLTIFPDGRAIVGGTEDPAVARGLYARHVGA